MRSPSEHGATAPRSGVALLAGIPANPMLELVYAVSVHFRFVLPEEAFLRVGLGGAYAACRGQAPRWLGFGASGRERPQVR